MSRSFAVLVYGNNINDMVLCLVVSDVYQLSICLFISKSHSIDLHYRQVEPRFNYVDLYDDYEENFVFDSVVIYIYILFRFMS